MFDNRLNEDGGQSDFCAYNPKVNPKDSNSADAEVPMRRVTGEYHISITQDLHTVKSKRKIKRRLAWIQKDLFHFCVICATI